MVEIDDPVIGKFKCVGPVLKCADASPAIRRPAPRLGEHQQEVESKGWLTAKTEPKLASNASLKHPLQGVKIVDFGNYFAGPYASRLLSDLGADVIKVEPPSGDTLRPTPTAFRAAQRGKRSLALDLKTPEGKALAHKLIQWADVMTHNMRADTADKLGLGFEQARKLSPKIVYLHSAGFGATGPRAKEGAFAPLVAGLCGLAAQAAGEGNAPVQSISNEDHHSGALGASWLMMGLNYVARTGKAVKLDTSLLAATLYVTSELMLKPDDGVLFRYALDKDATGLGPLSRIYEAGDEQWVCLVVEQQKEWKALAGVAGLEALGKDARFATPESRRANASALAEVLAAWFAARPAKAAAEALTKAGVPAEVSQPVRVQEHFFDAENLARGRIVEYRHSTFGRMRESGHVLRFSETPGLVRGPSPLIGEHSLEVFAQFGIGDAEARAMRERKVTTWPESAASKAA
jgi:crotonobetainyl-CoA:carnitine CoA-transferase CaiB-like acyl-CoA transferase